MLGGLFIFQLRKEYRAASYVGQISNCWIGAGPFPSFSIAGCFVAKSSIWLYSSHTSEPRLK
jgi:hypothetical protein